MSDRSRFASGLVFASVGSLGFSGKAIIVKLVYLQGADALSAIALRMGFALPFFLAMAWWAGRGRPRLSRRDARDVLLLGFSGYYLASYLDFEGLRYISASLERLIVYLNPSLVALMAWLAFGRGLDRRQLGGLAVAYVGVLLVFGHELRLEGSDVVLGASLVLASTVSYAFYMIRSGEAVRRLGAMRLVGLATSVACLLCLAHYAVLRPLPALMDLPSSVYGLSLLNATVSTALPVLCVMLAIERLGASLTAQVGMLGPLMTIGMGALILGERFNLWIAVGTGLVLGGIYLMARAARRQP